MRQLQKTGYLHFAEHFLQLALTNEKINKLDKQQFWNALSKNEIAVKSCKMFNFNWLKEKTKRGWKLHYSIL